MKTIACEHCATKYRVDPDRFSSPTPRIRCKKCGEIFTAVFDSDAEPKPVVAAATPPAIPAVAPAAAPSAPASATGAKILVAHENTAISSQMSVQLSEAGFVVCVKNDGVGALVELESGQYKVAVLDVALPKMFGFEVCEVVRRDRALDGTKLILIAAIYHKDRYRRSPSELYGADDFIEKQSLEENLVAAVQRNLTEGDASSAPPPVPQENIPEGEDTSDAPAVVDDTVAQSTPPAADSGVPSGMDEKALEKARRTGRVMVSDLALYNKEVFAKARSADDIYSALASDIEECRSQIRAKVSEEIQAYEDVLDVAIHSYLVKHGKG